MYILRSKSGSLTDRDWEWGCGWEMGMGNLVGKWDWEWDMGMDGEWEIGMEIGRTPSPRR